MRERARGRLKEAQSDGGTNYREVYQSHISAIPLFAPAPLCLPFPHPLFSCALRLRTNPLAGASSFCILIPPQRGADNLGRGFFKLAPLTRYAARWVSYRNNFRAPFPPNRRARPSSFFPWYIFFFPLLHSTVFTAKLMKLAPPVKRFSTQFGQCCFKYNMNITVISRKCMCNRLLQIWQNSLLISSLVRRTLF